MRRAGGVRASCGSGVRAHPLEAFGADAVRGALSQVGCERGIDGNEALAADVDAVAPRTAHEKVCVVDGSSVASVPPDCVWIR
jgi:hypothetical protein